MTKSHAILAAPFSVALLATVFCVWSALGNDVNFCVTTGCTLYQDFSIAGISMWWLGSTAFAALAACALLGRKIIGRRLAALFLLGDIGFLLLMAFTAPCVSCLVAALFFALCFWLFRMGGTEGKPGEAAPRRHSPILWAWLFLFAVNIGQVARSEIDVWPMLDESGDASTRMFFSVDCPYCAEGIKALAGKVDVAFYPVSENSDDVYRIAAMMNFLEEGMNMEEALARSSEFTKPGGFAAYGPEMLLLRFRLLRNKAHIFMAGSQAVPFFEQRGLPAGLARAAAREKSENGPEAYGALRDHNLPEELAITGQCDGGAPCPPGVETSIN